MDLPRLEIVQGESVSQVVGRLEKECQERGIHLVGFHSLNNILPTSEYSNFFQARVGGVETVLLVMTEAWSNPVLVSLLNILLEIRADPEPPGANLRFRIYSAHPVPPILRTLFGDYRISPVECRAAMVVRFGNDLRPHECPRLAAAALHFLRSLGRDSGFRDPRGVRTIEDLVTSEVRDLGLPPEGTPLNLLICLGCLYGELVRSELRYETEWTSVKEYQPWPCLVVRGWSASTPGRARSMRQLGFSPIALVIQLSQGGPRDLLEKSAASLAERCRGEFAPPEPRSVPETAGEGAAATPEPASRPKGGS